MCTHNHPAFTYMLQVRGCGHQGAKELAEVTQLRGWDLNQTPLTVVSEVPELVLAPSPAASSSGPAAFLPPAWLCPPRGVPSLWGPARSTWLAGVSGVCPGSRAWTCSLGHSTAGPAVSAPLPPPPGGTGGLRGLDPPTGHLPFAAADDRPRSWETLIWEALLLQDSFPSSHSLHAVSGGRSPPRNPAAFRCVRPGGAALGPASANQCGAAPELSRRSRGARSPAGPSGRASGRRWRCPQPARPAHLHPPHLPGDAAPTSSRPPRGEEPQPPTSRPLQPRRS